MTFKQMKLDELREVADTYAVDIEADDTKDVIVAKLLSNGVDWDYHKKQLKEQGEASVEDIEEEVLDSFDAPAAENEDSKVLMRMTRANGTFEVRGVRFTKANPYALVRERDADFIMDSYEGFRIASPREVKEFYG
jgi:hypothetical protein